MGRGLHNTFAVLHSLCHHDLCQFFPTLMRYPQERTREACTNSIERPGKPHQLGALPGEAMRKKMGPAERGPSDTMCRAAAAHFNHAR